MTKTERFRAFLDRCYVALHSMLPTNFLSWLMFHIAQIRASGFKNAFIGTFVKLYRVDLSEAEFEIVKSYPDFSSFFTRALKPDARPVDPDPAVLISPVDGRRATRAEGGPTGARIRSAACCSGGRSVVASGSPGAASVLNSVRRSSPFAAATETPGVPRSCAS